MCRHESCPQIGDPGFSTQTGPAVQHDGEEQHHFMNTRVHRARSINHTRKVSGGGKASRVSEAAKNRTDPTSKREPRGQRTATSWRIRILCLPLFANCKQTRKHAQSVPQVCHYCSACSIICCRFDERKIGEFAIDGIFCKQENTSNQRPSFCTCSRIRVERKVTKSGLREPPHVKTRRQPPAPPSRHHTHLCFRTCYVKHEHAD